jgi:hypothetical protein
MIKKNTSTNLIKILLIISLCRNALCLECLIHNKEYSYEYLYQSNENDSNAYVYPIANLKDFEKIRWDLIEFFDENYLIKSIKTNSYLCASSLKNSSFGLSSTRRMLHTSATSSYNCIWNIKKVSEINSKKRTYFIWNSLYNEQLYATRAYFFKKNSDKRNVYLWRSKSKHASIFSAYFQSSHETDRFKWIIDCSTGTFLSI